MRYQQTLTRVFIAVMLSVFLLAFPSDGYQSITEFKYDLFLTLCGGYIVISALLGAALALVGAVGLPRPRDFLRLPRKIDLRKLPLAQIFIALFLLCTAISSAISPYEGTFRGEYRQEGLLTIAVYAAAALLVAKFFKPAEWVLWLFGASVTIFCTVAFLQFAGFNPFTLYPAGMNFYGAGVDYAGQFLGTLGNSNLCAAVLCVAAAVFGMALFQLKPKRKWLLAVPLCLTVSVIFKAKMDAGIIAVLVGFPLMLPAAFKSGRLRRASAIFAAAVFAAAFAAVRFAPINGGGFLYEAHELLNGRWDDSFGSHRLYIWRQVAERLPERLPFGTGPDTIGQWGIPEFERLNGAGEVVIRASIDAAHNEYLNILACEGLFALVFYLAALAAALAGWYRRRDAISAIAGAAVLFYCIQALFGISMCATASFFWVALGILMSRQDSARLKILDKR